MRLKNFLEQFADRVLIYGSSVVQDLARHILDRSESDLNDIPARNYTFYASEQE
jgi:hypothetical protein